MQKPVRQFDINLAKFPNPRGPGRLTGRLQTSLFYLGGMMEKQIEKPTDEAKEMVSLMRRLLNREGITTEPLTWETIKDPEIYAAFKIPIVSGNLYIYAFHGLY